MAIMLLELAFLPLPPEHKEVLPSPGTLLGSREMSQCSISAGQKIACFTLLGVLLVISLGMSSFADPGRLNPMNDVYPIKEGFIDVDGLSLYYTEIGHGEPLVVLHGGPGSSHNYFLPYLLPLARTNQLIFMDERVLW